MKSRSRALAACLAVSCLAAATLWAPAALAAPAPAWEPIAASGPTNLPPVQSEVQGVAVDATAGTYTLSFKGQETGPIAFNAEASELEAQLNGLSTINGAGSVSVAGGPGDEGATSPYSVAFQGSGLEGEDVPQMIAKSAGLEGGLTATAIVFTAVLGGPGTTSIVVYAQNVGGAPSSVAAPTELTVELPEGIVTTAAAPKGTNWACTAGAGQQKVECATVEGDPKGAPGVFPVADPGFTLAPVSVPVRAEPGADSGIVGIEVTGGAAALPAGYEMPLMVSALPAPPGLQAVTAAPYKDDGAVDDRAGAHPYSASAGILVNTVRSLRTGLVNPAGEFRDIVVDTPPGFFGNPLATPQCPEALPAEECDQETIVATAQVAISSLAARPELSTVNNIEAPFGYPGKFRFRTGQNEVTINVVAGLRSDEDYGLEAGSYDTPQIRPVYGSFFTFWGNPLDEAHDDQRCREWNLVGEPVDCPSTKEINEKRLKEGKEVLKETAFLTNPLDCAEEALRPPLVTARVNTWQNPGLLFTQAVQLDPVIGCDHEELRKFEAGFDFQPGGGAAADSPASFTTEITTPTGGLLDPDKRTNPTIRETVVELPEGVVLNASAADGLQVCSFEQVGYLGNEFPRPNEIRFSKVPDSCPDASKIGSGELKSELIEEPLQADLFLAEQGEGNPFGSLFAIYLVIEDPRHGIFIKLPGEVQVNESTGGQKVIFRDLPPLPFTYLKLNLKGGARSPLATPTVCGDYQSTATHTPWSSPESGPPLATPSTFAVDGGPSGIPCAASAAARPFNLGMSAGSESVQAGASTQLNFRVTRPDGSQELDTLRFDLPPGLAASLKGISYCSEAQIASAAGRASGKAEQADPSCPLASRIGRTLAGAGSGPAPFYAPGTLYLAGPYKGHPLSVVAITPAIAGPFDLGNVVIRNAVRVDPVTGQVSAISDPLPLVFEGVPLRLRDVRVILDRPGFGLNPTSCAVKSIGARITGASGAVANLSNPFQVGNCDALGFKPKTRIQLFGGVTRGKYQGVRAVVRPRPGDANISRAVVRFPTSAFVAQEHIRTVCTRVQFAADACPKGSIYGKAIARTPLLDYPLEGNVYLRSSDNELPDAVADLRGPAHQPVRIEVAIRNDSVKGALRNTVLAAPDAPVSYFRLQMFGGKKGLIVNSRNICEGRNVARVGMKAHNGRESTQRVNIFNKRCKKAGKKQRKGNGAHRGKRSQ
jgi:hypothetical protein